MPGRKLIGDVGAVKCFRFYKHVDYPQAKLLQSKYKTETSLSPFLFPAKIPRHYGLAAYFFQSYLYLLREDCAGAGVKDIAGLELNSSNSFLQQHPTGENYTKTYRNYTYFES